MVGRQTWRKSAAFLVGVATCSAFLFATAASKPQAAGDLLDRLSAGLQRGIRSLTGGRRTDDRRGPAVIRASSAREHARAQALLARDRTQIRLAGPDFDPLEDASVPVDTRLPASLYAPLTSSSLLAPEAEARDERGVFVPGDVEYWIVQYGEGSAAALREQLEKLDAEIVGFVPNAAYLVRVGLGDVGALRGVSEARWSGRFHPSFKIDEGLRSVLDSGGDTSVLELDERGRVRIELLFHRDVDGTRYHELIKSIPGIEISYLRHEHPFATVGYVHLPPASLAEGLARLARLRDVAAVQHAPYPKPANDHSVWYLQSGINLGLNDAYDDTASLFARGIDGRGLAGAVGDSHLETDLCQFRYSSQIDDAVWDYIDGGLPNIPPPEEGELRRGDGTGVERTRLRKTVAYYVMPGATGFDSDDQHGTGVAGCMLGDNYGHPGVDGPLAARPLVRDLGEDQFINSCDNPAATWTVGQELRVGDPLLVVDDPSAENPAISSSFGNRVQHHAPRDGMAPGAQLVFFDLGAASGEELTGVLSGFQAFDLSWKTGATVFNASYGGNPCENCYGGNAIGGDFGSWLHRIVLGFTSAGNEGERGPASIGRGFAQAKNLLVVGATERGNAASLGTPRTGEDIATFSSRGPKTGGLLAPEIVGPGIIVTAANDSLPALVEDGTGSGDGGCIGHPGNTQGTSFSSPTVAGTGLLVQQYFMDGWYPTGTRTPADALRPSNALVRAIMMNSARDLEGDRTNDDGTGQGHRPSFGQGWGAPRLDDTLFFEGDPVRGLDPLGDTQRARLLVLTDTFNGLTGTDDLLAEPGGKTRDEIVQSLRAAITEGTIERFPLNVVKGPTPGDPADELRVTMCYSDLSSPATGDRPTVNDLDLEIESPSGVIYRPDPLIAWVDGYTVPSVDQEPQSFDPVLGFAVDADDRDPLNTCENIFIAADEVEEGPWELRVIGFDVPGNGDVRTTATPNLVPDDLAASIDLPPCDGVPDIDATDRIRSVDQGYALVVSGNFTTTAGLVSVNKTNFSCSGEELVVFVTDQNGDDVSEPPCPDRTQVTVRLTTTTPNAGFTADRETLVMNGAAPQYQSNPLPVQVVSDPAEVIHGDGVVQIAEGEVITVSYQDNSPCGGRAIAQATVSCRPAVSDSGFSINEGCDLVDPSDGGSDVRPDGFLDADEDVLYTVFFDNDGGVALTDAVVSLRPDPTDPLIVASPSLVQVLNSPQTVGLAPPGRRSDATFFIRMGPRCDGCDEGSPTFGTGIPARYSMDFITCITSPRDGLLFPDCFTQTQSLEADVQSFRYDTRDPTGELYGLDGIEQLVSGASEDSMNPADYVRNAPMWFDPDADCDPGPGVSPCSTVCDVPRSDWDAANIASPGSGATPPPICFSPGIFTGNPTDPWDFEEDDEGFVAAAYEGDQNQVGPPVMGPVVAQEWFWKAAPDGGGCGWEDEIMRQIEDPIVPGDHPDLPVDPWGIWHTGAINETTAGPFPGAMPPSAGVPHNDDEQDPDYRTILWDPPGAGDNSMRQWCNSYLSNTALPQFYRSFLVPPSLFRVHRANPEFRVEFQDPRWYSRLDGHTVDGDNLAIAGWHFSNEPIPPLNTNPRTHSWSQYETLRIIFADDVRDDWSVDDNFLDEALRSPDPSFPDLHYEDFFGPAQTQWDFAFSWSHLHFDGFASGGEYGWGIDDVSFVWTESRDIDDQTTCGDIVGGQPPLAFFAESRYNACAGEADLVVLDAMRTEPRIAVCVSSAAEDFEVAYLEATSEPGRYEGSITYNSDPAFDVLGTLRVNSGQVDVGQGADTIVLEYDPSNPSDWNPDDPGFSPEGACDWQDLNMDGNNDLDVDGTPIAEDGAESGSRRERFDSAVINCTSGLIYPIRHRLEDADGAGDGDRFADRGETVWMSLRLASQLPADLTDVTLTLSTEDETVCILQDTVEMDLLEGTNNLTDTPIDPSAEIGRQGFLFAVPADVRTTALGDPKTVTFRIDVQGLRSDNLNEFTTFGDGFNSFLPIEITLALDLDENLTSADYMDAVNPGPPGVFLDNFEGPPVVNGFDHPRTPGQPGWRIDPINIDATMDTRWGADMNSGFCPECDDEEDCRVPDDCEFLFNGDNAIMGAPEWQFTNQWSHDGLQAMKFGRPGAGPSAQDQAYREGQYAAIETQPLYIATDPAVTPELSFWHIADFWLVSFTGGLDTVLGSGVVEISPNPEGLPLLPQQLSENEIRRVFPTSSFRRLYPYEKGYDAVTDALNACRTLFCANHHPVFGRQGDPLNAPSGDDPRAGDRGGTWEQVKIDLSDYRGMHVIVRFTTAVLQDLDIQAGHVGWLIDEVQFTGISRSGGLVLETDAPVADPCGIVAAIDTTSADCVGDEVFAFDRHQGLGLFDMGTGAPFPIEYAWTVAGSTIRGLGSDRIVGEPGWRGVYSDPIIDLSTLPGFGGPGSYTLALDMFQDGTLVGSTSAMVVYKDAPVPAFNLVSDGPFAGGSARFQAMVSVLPSPDPARELVYQWDFGDGTAIDTSGPNVTHRFEEEGDYDVRLCVVDEDGCSTCVTQLVSVAGAPQFGLPTAAFAADCADPGSPAGVLGDGNGDYNEYITIDVSFTNAGAMASGVVGELSSSDRDVEIVQGAADFGDVVGASPTRQFTFIRRPAAADDAGCLVLPFTLTLVSNGGTVVQELNFSYTMGGGSAVESTVPAAPPMGSICFQDSQALRFTIPGLAGCLDGVHVTADISGTSLSTNGNITVTLVTPNAERIPVYQGDGLDASRDLSLDFRFDGDALGPIPNTGGVIEDIAGTLSEPRRQGIVSELTGVPMNGPTGVWALEVKPLNGTLPGGDCASGIWTVDNVQIWLEGQVSADLEEALEGACSACLPTATPIYDGLTGRCVPGAPGVGALTWRPAVDTTTCDPDENDLTYSLFGSDTEGELGSPVTILNPGEDCDDCLTPPCAFPRNDGASTWAVCGLQDTFWTVVIEDAGDAATRVPGVDTGDPASAVPAGYQSTSENCLPPPEGPIIGVTTGPEGGVEVWVEPPVGNGRGQIPQLDPGTGTAYTLFRGDLQSLRMATYDHTSIACQVPAPSVNLWDDANGDGIVQGPENQPVNDFSDGWDGWYYLMPGLGPGGCGGLGYQGTRDAASGLVVHDVVGRPTGTNGAGCVPSEVDCLP